MIAKSMLYDDGSLQITDSEIVIHKFYFPFGRPRRVRFDSIRRAELKPLTFRDGKARLWGMGLRPIWFHLDAMRFFKKHFVEIDTGATVKIGLTPVRLGDFFQALQAKIASAKKGDLPCK